MEPVLTPEELTLIAHVDLGQFTRTGFLEPNDDQLIYIYSAPREGMVEVGDVVFSRPVESQIMVLPFAAFRVVYASSKRYPAVGCGGKVCQPLPYQLFLQLDRITDAEELASIEADVAAMDNLPF